MTVGRKPKPTHLKLLSGVPGHRPLPEGEPQPDIADAEMSAPTWLSGEARAVWDVEFPKLVRNNMIADIDVNAFAKYCQSMGRYIAAEAMVFKQGDVLIAPSGFPIQNPYLAISNRAHELSARLETEFGMTPSSRSRVTSAGKTKKANRFLDLVSGPKTKKRA